MKMLKLVLRYVLGLFFIIAGVYHFLNPEFYLNIMPGYLPLHKELVMLSGVTEVIAGLLMFFKPTMRWGAWGIVAMLVVFFSVHIDMIVHANKYPDVPAWALYFRLLLQFVLIAWAWWFTRSESTAVMETEAERV